MRPGSTWGRKETVVWPPHAPIYSWTTVALAFFATALFVWQHFSFSQTILQQSYTTMYIRSFVGALSKQHGNYRLIYTSGPKKAPRIALPDDFEEGKTVMPDGRLVAVSLSKNAKREGYNVFYRAPARRYSDASLNVFLRQAIFDGDGLLKTYTLPLSEGLGVLLIGLIFAVRIDVKRFKQMKYGRLLKGPVMLTPKQFNATLKGDGLGIRTAERDTILRLPMSSEAKHIQIMGDTGSGKSTLIIQILQQIHDRGDVAIVFDPAGEFTQRFYKKERGDWILNPLDARCPYWTPASELRTPAEARTIAASLYQPTDDKKGEFFTQTPQKIFAHLLKYRPTPKQLVEWMSNQDEIDRRVAGTELASIIAKDAPQQRSGVLASLGLVADSLRLLPTLEEAKRREWSATAWADKRKGWIFLTSTEAELEALRPLQSLWIDLLILRLLTPQKEGQKRAWLVIDELASLQRLPQFHSALTKGRKSNNPIIFGYQGKSQLEVIWGHLAEVLLSQPSTKFVLKTAEPKAAKWASELLGEVEIERVRETVADGRRAGKSFTLDRQIEPLVMSSEIEGLADLHTFVKFGNFVSRFSFPHMSVRATAPALVPRTISEEQMWFDPLTTLTPQAAPSAVAAPEIGTLHRPLPPDRERSTSPKPMARPHEPPIVTADAVGNL